MDQVREFVTYLNGRLGPHSQAMAELGSGQAQPVSGLYDAERTFRGELFKLREHLRRLFNGMELARVDPGISLDEMELATRQVLEANRELLAPNGDFILAQAVGARQSPSTNGKPAVDVIIYCQHVDFPSFARGYLDGVRVVTPVTYAAPRQSASSDGAGQPTFHLKTNEEGNVTECSHANFMFVRQGRIKLPDRQKVLEGISMETILELSNGLGIPVDEGDYNQADVYMADEAMVSGTRFCLLPVATFNGLTLRAKAPGPVTRRLLSAWSERVGVDFVQQALDHLPGGDTVIVESG